MIPKTRARCAQAKGRTRPASGDVFIDGDGPGHAEARPIRRSGPSRAALYAAYDFLLGPLPRTVAERDAMDDALDAIAKDMRIQPRSVL